MAIFQLNVPLVTIAAVTIAVIVIFSLLHRLVRLVRMFKYFQSFPGEPNYSIFLGNLHKLPPSGEGRIAFGRYNMDKRNPRYSRMWFGPFQPNIITYHPETSKVILKSSAPKSRGFGKVYEHVIPWIGEGLLTSNGGRWARARRLITPAFHFDILRSYVAEYNKAAVTLLEKLDRLAETSESFDICPLINLCTLDIILKCAMSYDADLVRKGHHPYANATRELQEIWALRARTPWMWPDFIFWLTPTGRRFNKNCNYVHRVAEEIIEKRRQLLKNEGLSRGMDFLDILLSARDEDGNPMSTLEIRNEVDTFMFAGHDTTANAIPWVLYTLALHSEYQRAIQLEVDEVLADKDSVHIEWSDLPKLQLLSQFIKETMRLYPPVPFIQRMLLEDTVIDDKIIPAGTNVTVAIIHMHKNPTVWDEPDTFKPERFSKKNVEERDTFSFIPFSAGSRNCIGRNFALNEIKVIIGHIVQRYNIELATDGPPIERLPEATLKSLHGIWLRLKCRNL